MYVNNQSAQYTVINHEENTVHKIAILLTIITTSLPHSTVRALQLCVQLLIILLSGSNLSKLSPSSIIGHKAMTLNSCEHNRGSGIALAIRHDLSGLSIYILKVQEREMSTPPSLLYGVWHSFTLSLP